MKKILLCTALITSCTVKNRIYYPATIDQCIHNLEQMQRWIQEDYQAGAISEYAANNYMIVIVNTKCSLYKKYGKKTDDCVD